MNRNLHSVYVPGKTNQRKTVFWHILHSVASKQDRVFWYKWKGLRKELAWNFALNHLLQLLEYYQSYQSETNLLVNHQVKYCHQSQSQSQSLLHFTLLLTVICYSAFFVTLLGKTFPSTSRGPKTFLGREHFLHILVDFWF